jgi:hypothetical protein
VVVSQLSVGLGYALVAAVLLTALFAIVLLEGVPYDRQERIDA